jgi:hypothetical protein
VLQRTKRDTTPTEGRQRLIGFIRDSCEIAWEKGFAALEKFKARENHCRVPVEHIEGAYRLGTWVSNQRTNKNSISAERREWLDAIGFNWDPLRSTWEERFKALTAFKAREGHCRVPQGHVEGTFKLGKWVSGQRASKDIMSAELRQRLDAIGFVWNAAESTWKERFKALTRFKAREGHCRVPEGHVEGTFNLGKWVNHQRSNKDNIFAERRRLLNAIGFVFDPRGSAWAEGFVALEKFKARENHCRVPAKHMEEAFKLGQWVGSQRTRSDTVAAERKQRLDAIGFVWRVN